MPLPPSQTGNLRIDCFNTEISENAALAGGGVVLHPLTFGSFTNTLIADNTATDDSGGMLGTFNLVSSTVVNNHVTRPNAPGRGGGATCEGGCAIENTIFWGNTQTASGDGSQLALRSGIALVRHCDIQGGEADIWVDFLSDLDWDDGLTFTNIGEFDGSDGGDLADNPKFVNESIGDFRIWKESPCIDSASNVRVPLDALDLDGDGNTTEKVPLDLFGAPRFVDDPETVDTGEEDTGYPDVTDMGAFEYLLDCNENGIPDWDAQETGGDANGNGLLDECEGPPTAEAFYDPPSGGPCLQNSDCSDSQTGPGSGVDSICVLPQRVCYTPKHRHLSFNPHVAGNAAFAHRISVKNAAGGFDPVGWVGAEVVHMLDGSIHEVVSAPQYVLWGDLDGLGMTHTVHVTGCEISTNQEYRIQSIPLGADPGMEAHYSAELDLITAKKFGDIVGPSMGGGMFAGPDGIANMHDIGIAVRAFQDIVNQPKFWFDVAPCRPDGAVNVADLQQIVYGFQGQLYPFLDPSDCSPGQPCDCTLPPLCDNSSPSAVAMPLVVSPDLVQPGEAITVDVYLDPVLDLASYEVHLEVTGGTSGKLVLIDIQIDSARGDYVFGIESTVSAVNVGDAKCGAVLMSGGTDVVSSAYLATFSYLPSNGATGVFSIAPVGGGKSMLTDSNVGRIPVLTSGQSIVGVGVDCLNDAHCDDKNACTIDQCVGYACTFTLQPSGYPCDDGFYCTSGDACTSLGTCYGPTGPCDLGETCCEKTDECVTGTCPP